MSILPETTVMEPRAAVQSARGRLTVCLGTIAPFVGGAEIASLPREALGLARARPRRLSAPWLAPAGPYAGFEEAGLRCL